MTRTQHRPETEIAQHDEVPCRACDRPMEPHQAYCLECGSASAAAPALPAAPAAPAPVAAAPAPLPAPARVVPAHRGPDPRRLYGVAGAGALACLLGGVLLGAAVAGEEVRPAPIRVNVPAAEAPVVNVQAPAAGGAVAAEAEPFVSDWPEKSGWTVQLQVLDKASTQAPAVDAAKSAATASGAPGVGALDSDDHDGLPAGKYIVYSKRFRTKADAAAAAKRLKADFPGAKAIQVKVAGVEIAEDEVDKTAPKAVKPSEKQLEDLETSTGDQQQEKSEELPDVVLTP